MASNGRVKIVVPGDEPTQIAGSPHLEKLNPFGEVVLYDTRPQSVDEKVELGLLLHGRQRHRTLPLQ